MTVQRQQGSTLLAGALISAATFFPPDNGLRHPDGYKLQTMSEWHNFHFVAMSPLMGIVTIGLILGVVLRTQLRGVEFALVGYGSSLAYWIAFAPELSETQWTLFASGWSIALLWSFPRYDRVRREKVLRRKAEPTEAKDDDHLKLLAYATVGLVLVASLTMDELKRKGDDVSVGSVLSALFMRGVRPDHEFVSRAEWNEMRDIEGEEGFIRFLLTGVEWIVTSPSSKVDP